MNTIHLLLALAAWLLLSSLVRFVRRRRASRNAKPSPPPALPPAAREVPGEAVLAAVGGACASLAIFLGAGLFLDEQSRPGAHFLAFAGLFATTLDLVRALKWPPSRSTAAPLRRYAVPGLTLLAGATMLSYVLYLRSLPGSNSEAVQLDLPVRGNWIVVSGGRDPITNSHHNQPPQQNGALDLILEGPPEVSEGQPVYAPVEALVHEAIGTRGEGEDPAEGNLIILRTKAGNDIWIAHLQKGSVRVAKGEIVRKGEQIAAVGSTGSAAQPHLHIHAQKDDRPVAIVFGPQRQFLVRGDRVTGKPPPEN